MRCSWSIAWAKDAATSGQSKTAVASYELPKRAEVEHSARLVYESFSRSNQTADNRHAEAASALSRMLLGPVAAQLGKKRLLVLSDGSLQFLPFAALPTPGVTAVVRHGTGSSNVRRRRSPSHPRPLIADHEIVSLPSASLLAVLRHELIGRTPAAKRIAVLASGGQLALSWTKTWQILFSRKNL